MSLDACGVFAYLVLTGKVKKIQLWIRGGISEEGSNWGTVLVLFIGQAANAVASEQEPNEVERPTEAEQLIEGLEAVDAYVTEDSVLDYEAVLSDDQIDQDLGFDFAVGHLVAGGELEQSAAGVEARVAELDAAVAAETGERLAVACVGRNDFRNVYPTAFLDSCEADRVHGLLQVAAGASTIAAAISVASGAGAVVAGTIAGALQAYNGLFAICGSYNTGIAITVTPPIPPAPPIPFCYAQ